ncbi:hypothetical protein PGT21_016336 [Puccinia graminis f. sp. tritici]|uniref:Uncharacterized protein n=1 Tax=Puccinia graminis f. sp. tritici TaxID=56615 RepID=A0A5B0QIG3_PUCGR|nr:hypothetical protein PGT21_016336 [Puccinia graminis f. sp. tritici]
MPPPRGARIHEPRSSILPIRRCWRATRAGPRPFREVYVSSPISQVSILHDEYTTIGFEQRNIDSIPRKCDVWTDLKVSLIDAVLQENGGMGDAFPRPPSAGRNAGNVLPLRTRKVISLNVNLSGDLSTQVFMYRPNR